MRRKRQIKRLGGSYAIHLTREDLTDFQLNEGDFVEIDDIVIVKNAEKN